MAIRIMESIRLSRWNPWNPERLSAKRSEIAVALLFAQHDYNDEVLSRSILAGDVTFPSAGPAGVPWYASIVKSRFGVFEIRLARDERENVLLIGGIVARGADIGKILGAIKEASRK
jgi:hypothetical protein